MFRILYLFILEDPPSWVAYAHAAVLFVLMGLTYVQSSRRRVGFMIVFLTMAGIFMVDIFGYLPFLAYVNLRDRGRAAAAAKVDATPESTRASGRARRGGRSVKRKRA